MATLLVFNEGSVKAAPILDAMLPLEWLFKRPRKSEHSTHQMNGEVAERYTWHTRWDIRSSLPSASLSPLFSGLTMSHWPGAHPRQ